MAESVPDGLAPRLVVLALALLAAAPALAVALAATVTPPPLALNARPLDGAALGEGPDLAAPFGGPATVEEVRAACPGTARGAAPCFAATLKRLLAARGSEAAFDVLDAMAKADRDVDTASHPIAHDLGRYAIEVYGSIEETLRTCSFKVFQGCFHGALEAHFFALPELNGTSVQVCPTADPFRAYTCLHGLGHGLMLATGYDLNASLELCDALEGGYAQSSCNGGVFMENWAGWRETQDPSAAAAHEHGATRGTERFHVDPSQLGFPCDAVAQRHRWDCWNFHTSIVLYFNRGDFDDAIRRCAALPEWEGGACFRSLGRDASSYMQRDALRGAAICAKAPGEGQGLCVRGLVADSVLFFATPEAGLPVCRVVPEAFKGACYDELAALGSGMDKARMGDVCAGAEAGYVQACRTRAGVA